MQDAAQGPVCSNCETELRGAFCSACGQEHQDHEPTLRQILADAWEEIVKVDGKIIATLRMLFAQPGKLTLAFFEGRRVRYVTPLKLYLTCSAFYFLVANFNELQIKIQKNGVAATEAEISDAKAKLVTSVIKEGNVFFFDHLSTILIVIVPLTALATAVLFRGRKRSLLFHLVFVLHTWSALFLLGALANVVHIRSSFFAFFLVASFVYMIFAARGAFGARWFEAIAKGLLFSVATFLLSVLALVIVMVGMAVQKSTAVQMANRKASESAPSPLPPAHLASKGRR